jgi:hypothetical protein
MKRLTLTAAASLALLAILGGRVAAQVVGMPYVPPATSPFVRPVVSPYVNLALPGNPGINYYGLVRPQFQAMNAINQLQTQYTALDQQLVTNQAAGVYGNPLVTGHSSAFLNHYGYFQNWRTRTGTVAGLPGTSFGTTGIGTPGPSVAFGAVTTGNNQPAASRATTGPKPPRR